MFISFSWRLWINWVLVFRFLIYHFIGCQKIEEKKSANTKKWYWIKNSKSKKYVPFFSHESILSDGGSNLPRTAAASSSFKIEWYVASMSGASVFVTLNRSGILSTNKFQQLARFSLFFTHSNVRQCKNYFYGSTKLNHTQSARFCFVLCVVVFN